MTLLDLNELDPGIRDIVARLRAAGFETTDSGDGVTKPPGPDVLPYPHVAMVTTREKLVSDSRFLLAFLRDNGIEPLVEATFYPATDDAVILASWNIDTTVAPAPPPPAPRVDNLVTFLYVLVRDHVLPGDIAAIMKSHVEKMPRGFVGGIAGVEYTNQWLAGYARELAARLRA